MDALVTINVRGRIFQITEENARHLPSSRLEYALVTDSSSSRRCYFFDRNPTVFDAVLDFYSSGKLHIPRNVCGHLVRDELKFWEVNELEISPCCWRTFYKADDTMDNLKHLGLQGMCSGETEPEDGMLEEKMTFRLKLWLFLDEPTSSICARLWGFVYYMLLFTSFIVDCLDTVPALRESPEEDDLQRAAALNITNPKQFMFLTSKSSPEVFLLHVGIFIVFSLEFLIRVLICPNKKAFFKKPLNMLELVVIPALCIDVFITVWAHNALDKCGENLIVGYILISIVKHLRLLRFFRLSKQFPALNVFLAIIKNSRLELLLFVFSMLITIAIASTSIYAVEFQSPDTFGNMLIALWWASITLTTVGYGDVVPKSVGGKIIGSICAILGVITMAMPISLIASNFTDLYNVFKDRDRRKRFRCRPPPPSHSNKTLGWLSVKQLKSSKVSPCN